MKTRNITIPKKDIYFDVDSVTHISSRARGAVDGRTDAIESDTGDDFSKNVVTRYADLRVAELKGHISRFIASETDTDHQVAISGETSYTITLSVENSFQDELLAPLANDMESYIATGVIADWFLALGDAQGPVYSQKLPLILDGIKESLVKRKFPRRV